jgi:serine-type anaerobic sulfatase-maturating enzyme
MPTVTSTATYRRLLDKLSSIEAKLSPWDRSTFRALLPRELFGPDGTSLEFLFAAPHEILSSGELEIFLRLQESKDVDLAAPCALRPSMVLVMKATRLCNLRCIYCHSWKAGPNQIMAFDVLAKTTRDALKRPEVRHVNFVWHGGEVTLLPIDFFKKALWLQRMFRSKGQVIINSIQTNATRLTDEWISFFATTRFDVGVSIDGPPEIHDRRRRTVSGRPTWNEVRAGIARMQQANVPCAVLVVVDRDVVELGAQRLLHCLLELKVPAAALLNVLPANGEAQPTGNSYLPWSDYVTFLQEMFRCWWPTHRHQIDIADLSTLIRNLSGRAANLCVYAGDCMGQFLTIEPNGVVNACDKYVGDRQFEFGNILEADLNEVLAGSKNLARARASAVSEVSRMRNCKYHATCRGGCPHDRRLNRIYQAEWDRRCCGLADLLDEISAATHNETANERSTYANRY